MFIVRSPERLRLSHANVSAHLAQRTAHRIVDRRLIRDRSRVYGAVFDCHGSVPGMA